MFKWLYIRKKIILAISIDVVVIFLLFFKSNLNHLSYTLFSWVFLSYLYGRYSDLKNITLKNKFFRNIVRSSITISIFVTLYYLANSLLNFNFNQIYSFIIFFLISTLLQYLFVKINIFNKVKQRNILVFYDEDFYDKLNSLFDEIPLNDSLEFLFFNEDNKNKLFDEIIIAKKSLSEIEESICQLSYKKNIKISTISEWYEFNFNRIPSDILSRDEIFLSSFQNQHKSLENRLKRFSDVIFSFFLLLATFPILLGVFLMIKIEDRGPIFYTQYRSGFKGKKFKIYKIRSMHTKAEINGAQWARYKDTRITKVGNFIRKTRLDELPQLINVLKGEMSLIGPRPERPEIDEELSSNIPLYNYRYFVKPGLSGWAQVNYPYGASIEDSAKKFSYDLFYMKNFSIWLDILIFFKTIKLIFNAKGASPKQ